MTIGEISLKFNGKLQILNEPKFKVTSELPWCNLNTEFQIFVQNGETEINNNKFYFSYNISHLSLSIYLDNILISVSSVVPRTFYLGNSTLTFDNIFNIFNLMHIESKRKDDILFRFLISGHYSSIPQSTNNSEIYSSEDLFSINITQKFSEREWLRLLSEMGYGEKMVIAIDRPKLEGYHEVLEFIDKANDGLLNNNNPDYIITDLRSAWDKMDVFILQFNKAIKDYINNKSKKEDKQPTKDERVENINKSIEGYLNSITAMKEAIDKFVQIGPHKEIYHSTREDALLAFRLTVSLMSYYSGILNEIKKKDQ